MKFKTSKLLKELNVSKRMSWDELYELNKTFTQFVEQDGAEAYNVVIKIKKIKKSKEEI